MEHIRLLCQMIALKNLRNSVSQICKISPQTNTIVLTIIAVIRRAEFQLSITIIGRVSLFGHVIYSRYARSVH